MRITGMYKNKHQAHQSKAFEVWKLHTILQKNEAKLREESQKLHQSSNSTDMVIPAGQLKRLLLERYQNRRSIDARDAEDAGRIDLAEQSATPLYFPASPSVSH